MTAGTPQAPGSTRRPRRLRRSRTRDGVTTAVLAGLTLAAGPLLAPSPAAAADDPTQGGLWYYTVPGIDQIHASGVTGEGITIAVIDGVINTTVADLAGAHLAVHEPSFCDADGDGAADPAASTTADAHHATTLAALIAGTGAPASSTTVGVAPRAQVNY